LNSNKNGLDGDVLTLNKIQPQILPTIALHADGFIDYAINLIESDRRYRDVFAYVFGSTVILKH